MQGTGADGADGKVVAITDWEFAHAGDATEDWVFCLAMRGVTTMPRERWLELFEEEAGVRLDPEAVAWWEVFNLFNRNNFTNPPSTLANALPSSSLGEANKVQPGQPMTAAAAGVAALTLGARSVGGAVDRSARALARRRTRQRQHHAAFVVADLHADAVAGLDDGGRDEVHRRRADEAGHKN